MIIHTLIAGANDQIDAAAAAGPDFDKLNPLLIGGSGKAKTVFTSPGGFISELLLYAFPIAGIILFVMILWGGFEMLAGATGKGKDAGRQRVTAAIVGFLLLFVAYWMAKLIGLVFGINTV
ncbi:hypothetical protein BH10PAT2_BH10PAT2_2070 [soil metagenome]